MRDTLETVCGRLDSADPPRDDCRMTSETPDTPIPTGFKPVVFQSNPYLDLVGPLYGRLDGDAFVLGFQVERRHCNPGGTCHGGMLMTLADMLLLLGANVHCDIRRYMTTVSVTNDFLAPAPAGSWLEGRVQVLRTTRSLIFIQGTMCLDGAPVLRTSGILKPVGEEDPRFGRRSLFE